MVVLVTAPTRAVAQRLARALLSQRLAACVNIVPGVESMFLWQGKLDRAREVLLLIKTTARRVPALQRAIKAQHPYQVPEIIALPVSAGLAPYLQWVCTSVA